jgi:hypothetical protein
MRSTGRAGSPAGRLFTGERPRRKGRWALSGEAEWSFVLVLLKSSESFKLLFGLKVKGWRTS